MAIKTGGLSFYNQKFADSMEHFDTFLMERVRKHPQVMFDRIPKGTLSNYEGLVRKSNIFHGGLGEQAGLLNWTQITPSRKPSGTDQGLDACAYDPSTFNYAMETIQYTGFRCSWQSEPICVNDIRMITEGRAQCEMIVSMMTYITQSVWENWSRENYVKLAVDSGHAFVLTAGGLDYADSPSVRFTYDPHLQTASGDTYITFSKNFVLSTLNWSFFDFWQDYLGAQCPEAALTSQDGIAVFGLMIHKRDFQKMVLEDAALREDFRFYNARVLIENYMAFKEFKSWALIHDPLQMRFTVQKQDGTTVTAIRVKPWKDGRAVTIGNVPTANPAYTKAELAIGIVFMNEVLQNLVPTPISNAGGGMVFGVQPGYNGTFKWINEYDRNLNPLHEVGYFFARFEAFPKPLLYATDAMVFLYCREPQAYPTTPAIESFSTATKGPRSPRASAATGDVDRTNFTVTLTLSGLLAAGVGNTVTLVDASSNSYTAIIGASSDAPTYTFICSSDPGAYTLWTTAATVTVS